MKDNHARLLAVLTRVDGWLTAGELADQLGVTPRSVRNYVTAIKQEVAGDEFIESGPRGYRIDRLRYASWRAGASTGDESGPRTRIARLARTLLDQASGVDVFKVAEGLHLSDSTIEADLTRLRGRLNGTGLTLRRTGSLVQLHGPETARRRLLSALFRDEAEQDMFELEAIQREFPTEHLALFKTALLDAFAERGDLVNEYGLNNVLLHIAIAIDRITRHHGALGESGEDLPDPGGLTPLLDALVTQHFAVRLAPADLHYLAFLLSTRVVTAGQDRRSADPLHDEAPSGYLAAHDLDMMREIVARASAEYLVDLSDEDFLMRLALHVRNLVVRAQADSYSRNPLTRSIKSAYPMIYELAVYIASELQRAEGIVINDDEIAYIAMHVGAQLEQQRKRDDVETSVVSPSYHALHLSFLRTLEQRFGSELAVVHVSTRSDVAWGSLPGELVISIIEPPVPSDRVVVVQPFLHAHDEERVRSAIGRVRRQRRRLELSAQLLQYFEPGLFLRNIHAPDEESVIRRLGARMVERGIIDERYVDGAIERERMSSTAFTDSLAVPHAMAMTAQRTAIAIAINESPMPWGGGRVNVVALIAFSASGRAGFQGFFDQFVEVFSERESVARLVRGAVDFPSFVTELAHVMDA